MLLMHNGHHMNVCVHNSDNTTLKSIPCTVYKWNIGRNNKQLSPWLTKFIVFRLFTAIRQTARAAICRADGVVKSLRAVWLRWLDSRVSVLPTPVRDGFTTSGSRQFIRPQWKEYENSGKLLYRSHPANASANLRFCPFVGLRCNWMTRALHFPREIWLVPSMNIF